MTTNPMNEEIKAIDREAAKLAEDWASLVAEVTALNASLEEIRSQALPRLRRLAEDVQTHRRKVADMVWAAPQLFEKPRTVMLHGFRVGYRKGTGGIAWDDDDRVVGLIERHLPDQFELLVEIIRRPVRSALAKLPVSDLKRIGCGVIDAGDEVVVKPTAGDAERLVAPFLAVAADR